MRVLLTLAGTDRGASGIGTYVREVLPRLADVLHEAGDEVEIAGTRRDLDAYAGASRLVNARTVLPPVLDAPGPSAAFHLAALGALARRRRADVLLLPAANRRLVAHVGVPTVAVVHDLAQLHVARKYGLLRELYVKHLVVGSLARATVLVAVSAATAEDLRDALPPGAPRARVVPNGVDHERFVPMAPDDPRVRAARAATALGDVPYVLYPSRLEHPGKNHVRLVRAFCRSSARDTHVLALAGKDWGARARIDEEVRRLDLGDRVRVLGFVADEHLPGLMAGADAVCMVGLREGFGLPALEALSAGRPVFAASTGALPEVVGDLGALCDPRDEAAIAHALERALLDGPLRSRVRRDGPPYAAKHGWGATARGLVAACREAVRP